jgi:hypothetical protein
MRHPLKNGFRGVFLLTKPVFSVILRYRDDIASGVPAEIAVHLYVLYY